MNDVIELGAVSTETCGLAPVGDEDQSTGQRIFAAGIQADD